VGPQRRDYALTESGFAALHEWAAVMRERTRLIAEFHELHHRDTCPLVGSVHPAHERGTGLQRMHDPACPDDLRVPGTRREGQIGRATVESVHLMDQP
jgi:hypothetical protein